jgi:hypothetical protein
VKGLEQTINLIDLPIHLAIFLNSSHSYLESLKSNYHFIDDETLLFSQSIANSDP